MRKKERQRFVECFCQLMESLQAERTPADPDRWTVITMAGALTLHLRDEPKPPTNRIGGKKMRSGYVCVFGRFEDPRYAKSFIGAVNPHSGKWNNYYFDGDGDGAFHHFYGQIENAISYLNAVRWIALSNNEKDPEVLARSESVAVMSVVYKCSREAVVTAILGRRESEAPYPVQPIPLPRWRREVRARSTSVTDP